LKVLHLIESLSSGGAERLLYTNLKYLNPKTVESEVVTVFEKGDYWRGPIENLGVPVKSLGCRRNFNLVRGLRRLRLHLKSTQTDIIHTHLWTANVIGRVAGRMAGIPVISSIHNPEYEPEAMSAFSREVRRKIAAARLIDKATAQLGCRRMIAVSHFVKESTVRRLGFPAARIDVVYNPIDISELRPTIDRREVIKELDLSDDTVVLLNVGRVSPQKGLIFAIRAMPAVLEAFPKAVLLSIGSQSDPRYLAEVNNEIAKTGTIRSVRLLGERRNVYDYLKACNLFVFPSLFEGLGIALAEAMAAGCACVANDIRPLDEFIADGDSGVLLQPRNVETLAAGIIRLLQDPAKCGSLGMEARRTALRVFDPRVAADKLVELYDATAGRP
jgi:glycosyltransferase involved in cell wall biosynthesis